MITAFSNQRYFDYLREHLGSSFLWDYLRYDEHGDLWINSLRVRDAVSVYGTPLEIHDLTIMAKRSQFWKDLVFRVASSVGYPGSFHYYYASKANMSLPYVVCAYRNGWMAETSSAQDLVHIEQLVRRGFLDRSVQIICNGFKFPVVSPRSQSFPLQSAVDLSSFHSSFLPFPQRYADMILELFASGYAITPIFDSGEVDYFISHVRRGRMDIGLRLKFGIVHDDNHLLRGISRHGMSWTELVRCAEQVVACNHFCLTMLHVMVSAAQVVSVGEMVRSLLFGAEKFFLLKRRYPTLRFLNIGGGIPSLSTGYHYELFLREFLSGLLSLSKTYSLDPPDIVFEFGSYLAEECGFYVHRILQRKNNSFDRDEGMLHWAIIDGGLMAGLPDMFITRRSFQVIAGNNAYQPFGEFVLGDLSCDSDGRYPPRGSSFQRVLLPFGDDQLVVIAGVGAYQRMLGGAGGAHHCGILNAGQLYIDVVDGVLRSKYVPPQSEESFAQLLGYGDDYF